MSDLANIAAAQAAGYGVSRIDRGASSVRPRYVTRLDKWMAGGTGEAGFNHTAEGESSSSSGAADTAALTALNGQRADRANKKTPQGGTRTIDVN